MGTRLNTILAAAALAISSSLLLAPAADADGVPKTKTNKIVVGKSLAGVKIGMSMTKAAKKWKKGASTGGCFKPSYSKFTECMSELSSPVPTTPTGG